MKSHRNHVIYFIKKNQRDVKTKIFYSFYFIKEKTKNNKTKPSLHSQMANIFLNQTNTMFLQIIGRGGCTSTLSLINRSVGVWRIIRPFQLKI